MRAAVYLRQSQDREGLGLGVDRQREDCLALIDQRGWQLVEVFTDNDTSAAGTKPRPAFDALLTAVKDGRVDAVAAWSLDRLTRNRRDQLRIIETCEPRKTVIALCRGSDIDLSTPGGRMIADVLATIARHEIEQKSDRQRRAQAQAAQQGRRVGGRRPFGYEHDGVTIRPREAAAIRAAYNDLLSGIPLGAIARQWNAESLNTGKLRRSPGHEGELSRWTHDTVRKCLENPRYAGIRRYNGEEMGAAQWPAIVSEHTYRAARFLLDSPERHSGGMGPHGRQLLTGLAYCGTTKCGLTVLGGGASHRKKVYRCRSMRHVSRMAAPVDDYVSELVIARLSRPDARDLLVDQSKPDVDALRNEALALRGRLDSLAADFADGSLTASQLRTATERLRSNLAAVEHEIADAGRVNVLGPLVTSDDVREAWAGLNNDDRKRAVIDTLMTIHLHTVGRGTRTFRPETVEVTWKTA